MHLVLTFAILMALSLEAAPGASRQRRFGIFMPKLDVYTDTRDVQDRLISYLTRFKPDEIDLGDYPIISEDDLESYEWSSHTLQLLHPIWFLIREPGVRGLPFVVVADGVPLYVGAFWNGLSSFGSDVPIILWNPAGRSRQLVIQRGIPSSSFAYDRPDPRPNSRLKQVLQELGKLKDDTVR